jgi:hypothetical protein
MSASKSSFIPSSATRTCVMKTCQSLVAKASRRIAAAPSIQPKKIVGYRRPLRSGSTFFLAEPWLGPIASHLVPAEERTPRSGQVLAQITRSCLFAYKLSAALPPKLAKLVQHYRRPGKLTIDINIRSNETDALRVAFAYECDQTSYQRDHALGR